VARTHHADAAVSTSDLELVKGIGPKVAAVLHDAGINGLAELVASTPEELARNLAEHQVRVPAEKIVTDDWLGQARTLLHDSAAEAATNSSAGTKGAIDQPWQELAGFSVFVERDALGRTQTRLTDYNSGEEQVVAGHTPDLWVPWIMERLPAPLEEEVAAPAPRVEVENSVAPIRGENGELTGIEVTVHFRLANPPSADSADLDESADEQYRAEVHLVDADSGNTAMFKEHRGRLQADRAEYVASLSFPAPDSGRYQMFSSVQLGTEAAVASTGPSFRVQ